MKRLVLAAALFFAAAFGRQPAPLFFFLQFSDPQFGMFTSDKDFAQETANFEFAMATANRLRPAFVVVTGDLVNKPGDPAQIAEYQRIASKLDRAIPLYNVPGNHDVTNAPTPETVAAYVKVFGPDHYTFTAGGAPAGGSPAFTGIVINSTIIAAPDGVPGLYAEQDRWLRAELSRARAAGAGPVVIFQHHPWFLRDAAEPNGYYNIPLARRTDLLALLHASNVRYVFAGHYHNNSPARDGDLEMITSGPVGKPQGTGARSGIRVGIVRGASIEHRFYELSELPNKIQ